MFLCCSTANWHNTARCVRSQDYKLALKRPAGHFQLKWGQAVCGGQNKSPPCLNRINVSAKSKWGQIPTVPISSNRRWALERPAAVGLWPQKHICRKNRIIKTKVEQKYRDSRPHIYWAARRNFPSNGPLIFLNPPPLRI
jgi:hypothetical protein